MSGKSKIDRILQGIKMSDPDDIQITVKFSVDRDLDHDGSSSFQVTICYDTDAFRLIRALNGWDASNRVCFTVWMRGVSGVIAFRDVEDITNALLSIADEIFDRRNKKTGATLRLAGLRRHVFAHGFDIEEETIEK
jgi:hypothetical protein